MRIQHSRRGGQVLRSRHAAAEAGVTWLTVTLRAPIRAAYLENLAWFSDEIMARFDAGKTAVA